MQYELTIDPELESLCPKLTDEELAGLDASIEEEGCRDDIILWANHDKTIIDGHNRYRLCMKHKRSYKTRALTFKTKDEVKLWMLRNQMSRRNLSESQRAMIAARLANLTPGRPAELNTPAGGIKQDEAAEQSSVSVRSVQRAKQIVEHGTPELQQAVTNGDVSVSAGAVVSTLPPKEQRKVVAKGSEAVKAKAKQVKAEKKESAPKQYNDSFDTETFGSKPKNGSVKQEFNDATVDELFKKLTRAFDDRKEIKGGDWKKYKAAKDALEVTYQAWKVIKNA